MSRHRPSTLAVALAGSLSAVLPACQGEPPKRPNLMHPLIERRASEILSQVFGEGHLKIEADREARINGKPLTIDLAAAGHKYGIAYVTREQQAAAGDGVPRRDPSQDALIVVDTDAGERVLVLYERDYMTDDLAGESHSTTTIEAETKLQRDARDFLLRAVRDKWP